MKWLCRLKYIWIFVLLYLYPAVFAQKNTNTQREIEQIQKEVQQILSFFSRTEKRAVNDFKTQYIYMLEFSVNPSADVAKFIPAAELSKMRKEQLILYYGEKEISAYNQDLQTSRSFGKYGLVVKPKGRIDNPRYVKPYSNTVNTDNYNDMMSRARDFEQQFPRDENRYALNDGEKRLSAINIDDLNAYRNSNKADEEVITNEEIDKIIESCINSSEFCKCLQSEFTKLTGKRLQNSSYTQAQIGSENERMKEGEIIAAKRLFNEYLGKMENEIYTRAEKQKKNIDDELNKIEEKYRNEWTEKYKSAEMIDMAEMASFVYHDDPDKKLPKNWEMAVNNSTVQNMLDDFNSDFVKDGFYADIYKKKGTNEYVLAFRGSENPFKDPLDWATNASQAMGSDLFKSQYDKALKLIKDFQATCDTCSISITGHSLGGGLASAAGLVTGLPTYTFNAAGVHENTIPDTVRYKISQPNEHIKAYHSKNDPLSLVQDNRNVAAVSAGVASAAVLAIPGATALSLAGQCIGVVSGTPEGTVAADVINKFSNPVSTISSLPPALGDRIDLGQTGGITEGHSIEKLIDTVMAPLRTEQAPLVYEKMQIDNLRSARRIDVINCRPLRYQ